MRLRQKLLIIIGVLLLSMIVVLYATSETILLGSFVALETNSVTQNMQRVVNVLNVEREALELLTSGWAWWDDTYAFIQHQNSDFRTTYLQPETFASLRVNAILLYDTVGELVYAGGYDLYLSTETEVPTSLQDTALLDIALSNGEAGIRSGYVALPEGPMLIVIAPVYNDRGDAPPAGTMIWGRFLNTVEIQRLAQITRLPIDITQLDSSQLEADQQLARTAITPETPIYSQTLDDNRVGSYATLNAPDGQPTLLLRIIQSRDIYGRGQSVVEANLVVVLAFSILSVLIGTALLDRAVINRLLRLTDEVDAISQSSDVTARVTIDGHDEIASLASGVNTMLGSLGKSQHDLAQAQEQLVRSARLAAAGEIAAGVAHQINNPLTTIIAETHLLTSLYDLDPDVLESVEAISEAANRAGDIVQQMLDLARSIPFEMHQIDVNTSVQSALMLVKAQVEPYVNRLAIELSPDIPPIKASGRHLEDVVWINLLLNARDAVRNTPEGEITVRTRFVKTDTMVEITIADNGVGIEPEEVPLIFTPFFTTKSYGTGLGLAICLDVVQRHGGTINVESKPNKGATFTVRLPVDPDANNET